jgi:hypothetical protein
MPTQVQLCNLALAKCSGKPITTIADTTPRAEVCAREYQDCLNEVLEAAFWRFAITRSTLVAATAPAFGYTYAWTLPTDFVAAEIFNDSYVKDYNSEALFKIEGSTIVTDAAVANLVYIKNGTLAPDTVDSFGATMTPMFVNLFTTLLGSKVAPTIKNDGPGYATSLLQRYQLELTAARTKNANMRKRRTVWERTSSAALTSRRQSTNG